MKHFAVLSLLASVFFLSGCETEKPTSTAAKFTGIPPKALTVTVTCSDQNTRFMGSITTDGETDHLVGMSSGTYQTSGHEIFCEFKKTDKCGRITLTVSSNGKKLGNSSTDEDFGGVRADLFFAPPKEHALFTTF